MRPRQEATATEVNAYFSQVNYGKKLAHRNSLLTSGIFLYSEPQISLSYTVVAIFKIFKKIFELLLKFFFTKKKDIHNSESNPLYFFSYLSPLPLHYLANPPQFRKITLAYFSESVMSLFLSIVNNRKTYQEKVCMWIWKWY